MKTDLTTVLSEKFTLDNDLIDMIISLTSAQENKNNSLSVGKLRKALRTHKSSQI